MTSAIVENNPIVPHFGINVYAYVDGNPVSEIDPLGLWAWGDPLPEGVVNGITGFGDGAYQAVTREKWWRSSFPRGWAVVRRCYGAGAY